MVEMVVSFQDTCMMYVLLLPTLVCQRHLPKKSAHLRPEQRLRHRNGKDKTSENTFNYAHMYGDALNTFLASILSLSVRQVPYVDAVALHHRRHGQLKSKYCHSILKHV